MTSAEAVEASYARHLTGATLVGLILHGNGTPFYWT